MQLQHKTHEDLKKQLQIKFVNEEGIDEGGVQKEFFQLAMRELIDPKYGKRHSVPVYIYELSP